MMAQARYACTQEACGFEFIATAGRTLGCPRCRSSTKTRRIAPIEPMQQHIASLLGQLFRYVTPAQMLQDAQTGINTVTVQTKHLPNWYYTVARVMFLRTDGVQYLKRIDEQERDAILDQLLGICPAHAIVCWQQRDWYARQVALAIEILLNR